MAAKKTVGARAAINRVIAEAAIKHHGFCNSTHADTGIENIIAIQEKRAQAAVRKSAIEIRYADVQTVQCISVFAVGVVNGANYRAADKFTLVIKNKIGAIEVGPAAIGIYDAEFTCIYIEDVLRQRPLVRCVGSGECVKEIGC